LADRTKVIELEPSAEGYTARAIVYEGLGQGRNAEADYRAALALEPDHEEAKAGLESLGEP
jgi:Tfp pilus assembly protein PilF